MINFLKKICAFFKLEKSEVIALLLGAVTFLAFAPFYFFIVLYLSFSLVFLLFLKTNGLYEAFRLGLSFGFGFSLSNYYWMIFSFLVEGQHLWLVIPAIFMIPLYLAIYPALAFLLCKYFCLKLRSNYYVAYLLFTLSWFASEVLKGHSLLLIDFTGFPWNLLGYSLMFSDKMIQLSSIIGVYGLSFIVILLVISGGIAFISRRKYLVILFNITILGSLYFYGDQRLSNAKNDFYEGITINLVHPNIGKHHNYSMQRAVDNINHHISLSKIDHEVDLTIWPESGISFVTSKGDKAAIEYVMENLNTDLITGAPSSELVGDIRKFFNSMYFLGEGGKVKSRYDKLNLVPFGEYMPFSKLLPFPAIASRLNNFYAADEHRIIPAQNNIPAFIPLICYDAIFPARFNNNASWILNITNDIWFNRTLFGKQISTGLYQHFDIIRMRAVEEGKPLVRVANKGITGVVDPYGRVLQKLDSLTGGDNMIIKLPKELPTNFYANYRNKPIFIFALLFFIFIYLRNRVKT